MIDLDENPLAQVGERAAACGNQGGGAHWISFGAGRWRVVRIGCAAQRRGCQIGKDSIDTG